MRDRPWKTVEGWGVRRTVPLLGGLLILAGLMAPRTGFGSYGSGELPERETLLRLFRETQDVLLTINSEILQYSDRVDRNAARVMDRGFWERGPLDRGRFVPVLQELNATRESLRLIETGLDNKYGKLKNFEQELQRRYPEMSRDIEHYFGMFDKIFDDCMSRQARIQAKMNRIRTWLGTRMKSRIQERKQARESSPAPTIIRPRRGETPEETARRYQATRGPRTREALRRARDQEILGQLESLLTRVEKE